MATLQPKSPLTAAILLGLGLATAPGLTFGHEPVEQARAEQQQGQVPLYDNLGNLSYPITTASDLAQRYFDQGLRWTYAFNHAEALKAFREAARLDPDCALCYWGQAFVMGPNINAPMDEGAANPAVAAIAKARERAHHASAREQALIEALARRYSDQPGTDQGQLNQAYADAMAEAHARFPEDHEIAVLYVDALMNLSPWDYWEADGETPKGRIGKAIAVAEEVLAADPEHPMAIHLYIHLTEASNTPERAEPYAERLVDLMPGAGHLVHMGSHTLFRIGRYRDSADFNIKAVAADEAYLAGVEERGLYAHGYYPHNIHFVVTSAHLAGDGTTALEYADHLEGKIPDEVAEQIGWIQAILPAPYFARVQYADPEQVLAQSDPGDRFPFVKAMWHYARGEAHVAEGRLEAARREAARIADLKADGDFAMLLAWAVPAPDLLDLARHVVEGRIGMAEGDYDRAIRAFEIATAIQETLPYTEPPYWYYPVSRSLGGALLAAGRAEEARRAFEQSLVQFPDNGPALWGLMQANLALGDQEAAHKAEARFQMAWEGNEVDPARL